MGLPQPDFLTMETSDSTLPFPAVTKQAAGDVNGINTEVMSMGFSDKIMITIAQNGRLAQWVRFSLRHCCLGYSRDMFF